MPPCTNAALNRAKAAPGKLFKLGQSEPKCADPLVVACTDSAQAVVVGAQTVRPLVNEDLALGGGRTRGVQILTPTHSLYIGGGIRPIIRRGVPPCSRTNVSAGASCWPESAAMLAP